MNIDVEEMVGILNEAKVEKEAFNKIIYFLEQLEKEKKEQRELNKGIKNKSQFVVVVKTAHEIKDEDIVAHVFKTPIDDDPATLLEKVIKAGTEQNLNGNKKKNYVTTFDDIVDVKRKFFKEENVNLQTKHDWVRVIVLPKDVVFGGIDDNA